MSSIPSVQPTNRTSEPQPSPYLPSEQGQQAFPPYTPAPPSTKSHRLRNGIIGGIAMLALIGGCFAAVTSGGDGGVQAGPAPTTSSAPDKTEPTKPVAPAMTKSQEQAIGSAEDYLDTSNFSKSGLIKQLEYEGYSAADANFAVTHIDVDWNEQAAGSAKDYLDAAHFSRPSLIKQLRYDGYTQAQAEYGVGMAGL